MLLFLFLRYEPDVKFHKSRPPVPGQGGHGAPQPGLARKTAPYPLVGAMAPAILTGLPKTSLMATDIRKSFSYPKHGREEAGMKQVELGRSGIRAGVAPFGAMYLGSKQDRAESFALLDRYLALGGDMIDTANIYVKWLGDRWSGGESETLIGEWLAARGCRNSVLVATKVGINYQDVPTSLARTIIRQECEKSLRRLGVETIDLYYAHRDDPTVPQEETLAAFGELVAEGKVRALGASNFTTDRLATANLLADLNGLPRYDVLQQRHTYLQPRPDADTGTQIVLTEDMHQYCQRSAVTVMAYSATLGGAYSGDPARPVPAGYATNRNLGRLAMLREIAAETGMTPLQVMLAWLWAKRGMTVLVAASTIAQLDENLAAERHQLDAAQVSRLDLAGL
jgi:aryl-alcohol dehydrogenase-like predicted oxidoreductase